MGKKRPDQISMMKMQDMIDIFYKLNRIKDNSYDHNYSNSLNDIPPIDKAENLIRFITKKNDNMTNQNAEILFNILKNVELINSNQNRHNKRITNSMENSKLYDNDFISKIKFFLKSLNDEE